MSHMPKFWHKYMIINDNFIVIIEPCIFWKSTCFVVVVVVVFVNYNSLPARLKQSLQGMKLQEKEAQKG